MLTIKIDVTSKMEEFLNDRQTSINEVLKREGINYYIVARQLTKDFIKEHNLTIDDNNEAKMHSYIEKTIKNFN